MKLQPYIVRQGDYLLSLAHQFGFDADAVWNDPKNADLRKLRPDPNVLYPTDVLYIPDQNPPAMRTLTTGSTNAFVSTPPSATLTIKFTDASFASQAYSVQELPELTGLTTDGNGTATFAVPVTLETVTLVFTGSGTSFAYDVGSLDPIETGSGVFQRLQNLGFINPSLLFDPKDQPEQLLAVKRAIAAFLAGPPSTPATPSTTANPSPSDSPPPSSAPDGWSPWIDSSGSAGDPPSSGSTPPSGGPASTPGGPASSPASTPGGPASDSTPPDSGPASSPASTPPESSPPSSLGSGTTPAEASHVNDDGTLDDDTRQKLFDAHGS